MIEKPPKAHREGGLFPAQFVCGDWTPVSKRRDCHIVLYGPGYSSRFLLQPLLLSPFGPVARFCDLAALFSRATRKRPGLTRSGRGSRSSIRSSSVHGEKFKETRRKRSCAPGWRKSTPVVFCRRQAMKTLRCGVATSSSRGDRRLPATNKNHCRRNGECDLFYRPTRCLLKNSIAFGHDRAAARGR